MRAGLTLLISAVLLAGAAPATIALAQEAVPAGTTASGTTGAQSATSCPEPRLGGLPKRPKFTNATIHFRISNVPVGAVYLVKAGPYEVYGATAQSSTVKESFLLPDQGPKSHRLDIIAIVDTENCSNAPWKLREAIRYKAVSAPATPAPSAGSGDAATPATPAPAATPGAGPKPAPASVKPPKVTPVKPAKQPWQMRPTLGTPLNVRMYMTPNDGAARIEQKVAAPRLGRLEQKTDKAQSNHALLGLGIVSAIFIASTLAGLYVFVRRDEIQFEAAMSYQLKHLEEGDYGLMPDEDSTPEGPPIPPSEEAPFAEPTAAPEEVVAAAPAAAPPDEAPTAEQAAPPEETRTAPATEASPEELARQRAEVEEELQRILTEAGVDAELQGILADARSEAERQGVAVDTDLMLQAIYDELNGSATLSDEKREGIRQMFATILAEETELASAGAGAQSQEAPAPATAS